MKVRKFTEEEIQYIIESYKTDSLQKIADNLKTVLFSYSTIFFCKCRYLLEINKEYGIFGRNY